MDEELKAQILSLCHKVEEVINNNDWPTTEGQCSEDGHNPLERLIADIRAGVEA